MAARKIRVRSRINGQTVEVAPQALRHFPDYERVDHTPEPVEAATPGEPTTPKPSTSRTTAAKTTDKE